MLHSGAGIRLILQAANVWLNLREWAVYICTTLILHRTTLYPTAVLVLVYFLLSIDVSVRRPALQPLSHTIIECARFLGHFHYSAALFLPSHHTPRTHSSIQKSRVLFLYHSITTLRTAGVKNNGNKAGGEAGYRGGVGCALKSHKTTKFQNITGYLLALLTLNTWT